ncbi:hypothetical protein V6U71_21480 [Sphingopyxis sp. J-6]|uniref:hypothetical protein n=1 Tax=Sphingopyxis sp. J-6 TaxID=3122054 RepID=UPI003983FDD5
MSEAHPTGETPFRFAGRDYIAVFDWAAIHAYEQAMRGESITVIVRELDRFVRAAKGGHPEAWRFEPRTSAIGELMRAGLGRYHPEVTAREAFMMFNDPAVQTAFGLALTAAMPEGDASGERRAAGTTVHDPRRRDGSRSSGAGARRGKGSKSSGRQHPA